MCVAEKRRLTVLIEIKQNHFAWLRRCQRELTHITDGQPITAIKCDTVAGALYLKLTAQ